jgi:predicted dehydrogenase
MGNQVRYAHCLQDVYAQIRAGDLGEIFYGEGEYLHDMEDILRWAHQPSWRTDPVNPQTTLLGGGPHALDTLRWLMGVQFTSVQAFHAGQPIGDLPVHTTVALARADNGAVAKITVSYGMVRPYCLYYSVYGTDGSFERTRDQGGVLDDTVNLHAHRRHGRARRMTQVQLPNFANPRVARRLAGQYIGHGTMEVEQATDFLAAILDDREPVIGPAEAAASTLPLICALQSAGEGGGLVRIPDVV